MAATVEDFAVGFGTDDFGIEALGAVGLEEVAGGAEGFGLCAGFLGSDFFEALALVLASTEAFVAAVRSATAFLAFFLGFSSYFAHSFGNSSPRRILVELGL